MKNIESNPPALKKTAAEFTKKQLTASKRYKEKKDLLNALLNDEKVYTLEEADKIINDFMKGRVR